MIPTKSDIAQARAYAKHYCTTYPGQGSNFIPLYEAFLAGIQSQRAVPDNSQDVLAACRYALHKEGHGWSDVMLSRTRERRIVELRYIVFENFWRRVSLSGPKKALLLGGVFDRTTMLWAIKTVEDWRKYDSSFCKLYDRVTGFIDNYLENGNK